MFILVCQEYPTVMVYEKHSYIESTSALCDTDTSKHWTNNVYITQDTLVRRQNFVLAFYLVLLRFLGLSTSARFASPQCTLMESHDQIQSVILQTGVRFSRFTVSKINQKLLQ